LRARRDPVLTELEVDAKVVITSVCGCAGTTGIEVNVILDGFEVDGSATVEDVIFS